MTTTPDAVTITRKRGRPAVRGPANRTKSVQFYVTPEQLDKLKRLAYLTDTKISEMLYSYVEDLCKDKGKDEIAIRLDNNRVISLPQLTARRLLLQLVERFLHIGEKIK